MFNRRLFKARPILASMAAVMLAGCGQSSEPAPGKLQAQLNAITQTLEQSQAALAVAEERIAALLEEQTGDRQRLAERASAAARLEQRNRTLEQQIAGAREELARSRDLLGTLRRERDRGIRQVRELDNERRGLHERLARANGEIRRLQARQSPDHRRLAELNQRANAAARAVDELRRYNGFLLQERGNLRAWLEEANATRARLEDAAREAQRETARVQSEQAAAEAAQRKLRARLEQASAELATLEQAREALENEAATLRAAATEVAESQRSRIAQLEDALAHASAPATARPQSAGESQAAASSHEDTAVLRAELDDARDKISRLRIAQDYLVEKVEACAAKQSSARVGTPGPGVRVALFAEWPDPITAPSTRPLRAGLTTATWPPRRTDERFGPSRLMKVATEESDPPKGGRHEKELNETRQKLKKLERDHAAVVKNMQALESECGQVREQVQTLTWANEVLVKELDTAYASRGSAGAASLPKGTRGIYVLRQGESLSRVAKAFYGDPGRWQDIVDANKDKIPDPDSVKAGTIILIPE